MTKRESLQKSVNAWMVALYSRFKLTPFFIISILLIIYAIGLLLFTKRDPYGFWQIPFFVSLGVAVALLLLEAFINSLLKERKKRIIVESLLFIILGLIFYRDLAFFIFGIEL